MRKLASGMAVTVGLCTLPLDGCLRARRRMKRKQLRWNRRKAKRRRLNTSIPSSRQAKAASRLAGMSSITTRLRARWWCTRRIGTMCHRTGIRTTRISLRKRACFTWRTFKSDSKGAPRPLTFLYNGGPGSSTVWLHMGAFGPKRVVTLDDSHTPAAPYSIVNNEYSLLDVSDLVFVDAPGTGFSRISGKDREKAFYGVDQDAQAFADFITQFLGKYGRWNSPKYMFGESYGTTRAAVLANVLETERDVDFNGVILLSQILNFSFSADRAEANPGVELPYQLALPTYAASAWYHHKLAGEHKEFASVADRGGALCDDRVRAGARGGANASTGAAARNRRKAPRVHGVAGRIYREGEPANYSRRIREDAAGRHGHDDWPAGYAFFRADVGSTQQRGGVRSAIGGDQLRVCFGVQRLRS